MNSTNFAFNTTGMNHTLSTNFYPKSIKSNLTKLNNNELKYKSKSPIPSRKIESV